MRRLQARSSAGVYPLLDIKNRPPSGMHSCLPAYSYTSFPPFPPFHPLHSLYRFLHATFCVPSFSASWCNHSFLQKNLTTCSARFPQFSHSCFLYKCPSLPGGEEIPKQHKSVNSNSLGATCGRRTQVFEGGELVVRQTYKFYISLSKNLKEREPMVDKHVIFTYPFQKIQLKEHKQREQITRCCR